MSLNRLLRNPTEKKIIQTMLDNFCELTGLAAVINDIHGQPLTNVINISAYCEDMRKIDNLCCNSDRTGANVALTNDKTCIYVCHAGLVDFAIPIVINDLYLGSIMAGQVRYKDQLKYDFSMESPCAWPKNEAIQDKYQQLSLMTKDQIQRSANVLEIIQGYIIQRIENKRLLQVNTHISDDTEFSNIFHRQVNRLVELMRQVNYLESLKQLEDICTLLLLDKPIHMASTSLYSQFCLILNDLTLTLPTQEVLLDYDDFILIEKDRSAKEYYTLFNWLFTEILNRKLFRVKDELDYAIAYVQRYHYKKLSVQHLANYMNLSQDYFSRLFKRRLGINFSDYLISRRITTAKLLLENTNDPIHVIGLSSGFDDASYFTRVFKKSTGRSPTQYRKSSLK